MFSGLKQVATSVERILKPESKTYVDPFIQEAFKANLPSGEHTKLLNWSRSYYTSAGHLESLLKYDKPLLSAPTEEEWSYVVEESKEYFRQLPKVRALSAMTDFDQVKYHQGTSAGYGYNLNPHPYPSHKGEPDGLNHKRAKRIASKIVYECSTNHAQGKFQQFLDSLPMDSTPDIAFTRTQLVELPDMKIRNVFGECFHYVLLEGLSAQPLIETFMALDTFYFIGHDPVIGVPHLINSLPPDEDCLYMTTDWSGFDSSVQMYEIELAFELLEIMLEFPDTASFLTFRYVKKLFKSRKIIGPNGIVYLRISGVPSGSYFTHLVDSIINWVRIRFLCRLNRIHIKEIWTHGDDGLTKIDSGTEETTQLPIDALRYGWKINIDHSAVVSDRSKIEFLGRTTLHGTSHRDSDRALRLMLYPEYPVTDPQISIARLKAIDADAGGTTPRIPECYHYMVNIYGDSNIELPAKFKTYKPTVLNSVANVSI
jgi:hypothetical protein